MPRRQLFKMNLPPSELAKYNKATTRLVKRLKTKVVKKAVRDTIRPVVLQARAAAPKGKTGMLRKSIKSKVVAYRRNDFVDGIVGVSRIEAVIDGKKIKPSNYAHLVEYGTGPRSVKNAKIMTDGEQLFGTKVAGARPQPFLRPTFDSNRMAMEASVRMKLKAGIEANIGTL